MDVEAICEKLKPVIGVKADRYWLRYLRADIHGKREIEVFLNVLYSKILRKRLDDKKILLSPPPQNTISGEYAIGKVMYNDKPAYPFGLREDELIQHTSILGRSGSGKSNLVYVFLLNFIGKNKPFLIFDWKKNYRSLLELLPEEKKNDTLIFTVGKDVSPLKYNPLIPPEGTPAKVWLKKLNEIVAHSYYLGDGCLYLLQKGVDGVYKEFGIYAGKVEAWPTMHDVLRWLEVYPAKGREANWMTSTIRAVSSMCFGGMGNVLNTTKQEGLTELLTKNCILELDALVEADKIMFIESLLLWIHHYRMSQPERETFKHAIVIEEAHHILLKQDLKGGESIVDIILREIRELGEAIILVDQCAGQISTVALANSYCTIAFNTKHQTNVTAVSNCMLFQDRSKEKDYLGKLPIGVAIVKLQDRWCDPFLIRVPFIKLEKGLITDNDVREHMRGYLRKQSLQQPQFTQKTAPALICNSDKINKEQKLLEDIIKFPSSGILERYQRLEFDSFLGNALKEALTKKRLIKTADIPTSKGRLKILELTNNGKNFLKKLGHEPQTYPNGPNHMYWKDRIARYFKKMGCKTTIEHKMENGKSIDVLVEKNNRKIAFEIETGKSDAIYNIIKDMEADIDLVVSVGINKEVTKKIIEQLKFKGLYENKKITVLETKDFEIKNRQKNQQKINKFVKNKVVTIAAHFDCDGSCSAALVYHTIKNWAKKIHLITKGVPFEITPEYIPKDTEAIICVDIKPSKKLNPSKIFYIDHHPNPDYWHCKHSIHDENTKSCSELIFKELINNTDNPYLVFLSLLGYFGDGGKTEDIDPELLVKAKQFIPKMLEKHNGSYLEIQKYVSKLNIGMRMLWNADFILKMLCETSSLQDFLSQRHPAHKRIARLKEELKSFKELGLDIKHGKKIDYAIISCPANVQGMLVAQNLKGKPLIVINTHNDMAIGSLRTPSHIDFDAGQYLQSLTTEIPGLVAGGHKKAAGLSLPEQNLSEFITLIK